MSPVFDSRVNDVVKLYYDRLYPHVSSLRGSWRVLHEASKLGADLPFQTDNVGQFSHHLITERKMLKAFSEEVEDADVVADIGGYRGLYGFLGATQDARSHVFEMTEENYKKILETQSLNHDLDVVVEKKAVWSSNTTVEAPAEGTGQSSVGEGDSNIDAVSLDSYFEARPLPDVVKIDVEGAEGHVLEGAEKVLRRSKPVLFVEFHVGNRLQSYGHSIDEIQNFLSELGYQLVWSQDRASEVHAVFKTEEEQPQGYWDSFQSEALPPREVF